MADALRRNFWWLVIFAGLTFLLGSGLAWPDWLAAVPLAGVMTWALSR